MKLGLPVLFEYNTVKENLDLAKELNLDFVELNLNFGYVRDALDHIEDFKKLVSNYDLEYTLHFYDEADFGTYEEVADAWMKLLMHYLPLAKEVNLKNLNVHLIDGPVVTISGVKNYMYEKDFDIYIKRLVSYLSKVDSLCKEYGVSLVLENSKVVSYMKKTYERLISLGYFFTFDIGHDNNNKDIVLGVLNEHPEMHFKELHIHDANRLTDHLSLGKGNVNLKFFKDLAIKNNAYALLEVKSSQDLRDSVVYFRNIK